MKKINKFLKARTETERLLGSNNVLLDDIALALNSFDGSPVKTAPDAVLNIVSSGVLPDLIKILNKYNVPFVPRMSATNHDGGCIALKGGAVLNLNFLDKIIEINTKEGYAIVESGVINQHLQDALDPLGFFYAPDPASMAFSTIGGNCALNAGGAKTLKYGSSTANILKAEIVTPQGDTLLLDKSAAGPGLLPLLLRSEGTLGIIIKLWVRILPKPQTVKTVLAYFRTLDDTMNTVKDIIAAGILPSALEAMDKTTMDVTKTPYPPGLEAMLIIETDGKKQKTEQEEKEVIAFCKNNNAIKIQSAANDTDRAQLWAKRKSAASSLAKLAPNLISLDCAVPRAKLPETINKIREIFTKYNVRAGVVFHAGDGNMHPNIPFDERNLFETVQIKKAVKEINIATLAAGGTISGEHGIGVEKRAAMALMFDNNTLNLFKRIKNALDPKYLANPDKVLPIASENKIKTAAPEYILDLTQQLAEPITVCGLKTKIKPQGKCIDISMLNKITDIDKTNYTVTVQAATAVKKLAEELGKNNMYLPIPSVEGSIGGTFAAKTFNTLEDFITGIDFVLPDGTFISLGGKHVKNAAGYDIIRFLSGSRGAYAMITSLTIRIFAVRPETQKQNTFSLFEPSEYEKKLKKVFDPSNILNPFIFGGKNEI